MKVMGIDPGGTTGYVYGEIEQRELLVTGWGEEADQQVLCELVDNALRYGCEVVVIERWVSMGGVRSFEPEALEIIGTVRYLCQIYHVPLVMQGAAEAKTFGYAARIKPYQTEEGGHVGHKGAGHALMALRHTLLYAKTRHMTKDPAGLTTAELMARMQRR